MSENNKDPKEFTMRSLLCAAALVMHGKQVLRVEPMADTPNFNQFIFIRDTDIKPLVDQFFANELTVEPLEYSNTIRKLRDLKAE